MHARFFFFFGGRWVCVVGRFRCWAWAWVRAGAGVGLGVSVVGDGWLLRSGFPVCVSALRHLVASGFRGAGAGGAGGGWLAAVVAWCLRGWSRLLGSAWLAWPHVGVCVGVFKAWAVWAVGTPLLGGGRPVWARLVCVGGMGRGVGYVCAKGVVGWVGALWAMQWVVEMLVMPTGGGVLQAPQLVGVADVGAAGDALGGYGVVDADGDGVVGDGAGAGGGRQFWWSP